MVAHTDTFLAGGNGVVVAVLLWHVLLKLANGLASPALAWTTTRRSKTSTRTRTETRAGAGIGAGPTRANSDAAWVNTHKKVSAKPTHAFAFRLRCFFLFVCHQFPFKRKLPAAVRETVS